VAHVALGANLDDPVATMIAALRALAALGSVGPVSSLWSTDPVGGPPDQPTYRNAVAVWRPAPPWATPATALAALLAIEQALGRERRDRWGPRRIDLDLLAWLADTEAPTDAPVSRAATGARGPAPVLPHPRALERPFVLVPWAEVAPAWRHPHAGVRIADAAARVGAAGVRPVDGAERVRWMEAVAARAAPGRAAGSDPPR
jgi:2-amino-4-hydroxy-6-hydroxymethyldihydropteridine diphosphokinase